MLFVGEKAGPDLEQRVVRQIPRHGTLVQRVRPDGRASGNPGVVNGPGGGGAICQVEDGGHGSMVFRIRSRAQAISRPR